MPDASLFTVFWLLFSFLWGAKAVAIRWKRTYAKARVLADTNKRFKSMSYLAFVTQIIIVPMTLWTEAAFLLEVLRSETTVVIGLLLAYLGLALYIYAFVHLGRNYSPCFDSHLPHELVSTGPYRFIRHPGWLSKILVGIASFLVSGSLWMIPVLVWLLIEFRRTIRVEESYLARALPDYDGYRQRTHILIPFLY